MNLKEKIFNWKRGRIASRATAFPTYSKIESVVLLYESEWQERNPAIRTLVRRLQEDDKHVVAWGYCAKHDVLSPNLPDSRIFGLKDFNIFGAPKQSVIDDLQRRQFDVLIDLSTQPILAMRYLAMYTSAAFKIGARAEDILYDMLLEVPQGSTEEYSFSQIMHYLKLIQSAD